MSGLGERRAAADTEPESAEALLGRGAAELAQRRPRQALAWLERAARAAPSDPSVLAQLGLAQKQSGSPAAAAASYERALELDPGRVGVWVNLGRTRRELGELDAAIAAFARALELEPNATIASMASNALREAGRHEEAVRAARSALRQDPRCAEAHLNEGAALHTGHRLEAAIIGYVAASLSKATSEQARANLSLALASLASAGADTPTVRLGRALLSQPTPAALLDLARLARQEGRPAAALVCFERALELAADAAAEEQRASLLWELGAHAEAERALLDALGRHPTSVALYRLLGAWFASGEQRPSQSWDGVPERCPDDALALAKLGGVLQRLGQPARALGLYQRLAALAPRTTESHFYVGTVLTEQGLHREACAAFERALELDPERWDIRSSLLFCAHLDADAEPRALLADHVGVGARLATSVGPRTRRAPSFRGSRRIRVGYVSPDFCAHPISYYIEPILREHAHEEFEVFCYSDVKRPDATTAQLARWAELVPVRGWSHQRLCERIIADEIDILVDLAGHTANNRLPAFARGPSPVQASWLGYFDTTGLQTMDYRIADDWSVPRGAESLWVERVLRLPRSANCYQPPPAPSPAPAPCLTRGHVTFGCFNNPAKIGRAAGAAFARILLEVPGSRLLFKYRAWNDPTLRQRHLARFVAAGIAPERIEFEGSSAMAEFLDSFARIDIALDPFPYSGETTALHTLWMGVPLVTLEGPTLVQRLGSRVLRVAGLHDWVADSVPRYVATAVALASDRARLARPRGELRARLAASPLLDHVGVTRELEAAYRQMLRERSE